jgi:hypothetical protein
LELLEGVSMRDALDEDALQAEQTVPIGVELLGALVAAHAKGFIHGASFRMLRSHGERATSKL